MIKKSKKMKIVKIVEHCYYKDLDFDIELEYYFDEFLQYYLLDVDLGNKNLQKVNEKYESILKEKNQHKS